MKKQRTKLLIIIVAVMAAVILAVKLKEPVSTLLQTPTPTPSATPLLQENDGRNMYLMEEFGVACGFKYTVKDVYLTRKYGGWVTMGSFSEDNEYYQFRLPTEKDVIDDNGDFLPGYYYLVVTLEIQNLAPEFQELSVTQNSIQIFEGNSFFTPDESFREFTAFYPMPEEDPDFDKYWQETMGKHDPNPDKLNRSCWWYLDPDESITVTMASGLVSDETVAKVLDGTWTLAIQPTPFGGIGRAYTGPGKLGQEDQIDPEILKKENFLQYGEGIRTTYIELPITEDSIRE